MHILDTREIKQPANTLERPKIRSPRIDTCAHTGTESDHARDPQCCTRVYTKSVKARQGWPSGKGLSRGGPRPPPLPSSLFLPPPAPPSLRPPLRHLFSCHRATPSPPAADVALGASIPTGSDALIWAQTPDGSAGAGGRAADSCPTSLAGLSSHK